MAPDQYEDELLDMKAASRVLPGHPSSAVVWRWCHKGVLGRDGRRICLEHRRKGGKLYTTRAALDAFAKTMSDVDVIQHFTAEPTKPMSKRYHRCS